MGKRGRSMPRGLCPNNRGVTAEPVRWQRTHCDPCRGERACTSAICRLAAVGPQSLGFFDNVCGGSVLCHLS